MTADKFPPETENIQGRDGMMISLEFLIGEIEGLEETIGYLESQIERNIRSLVKDTDNIERTLEIIAERRKTQLERMFRLGEAQAQLEELENRIQEFDEQEQQRQAEQERENVVPIGEDHLDWLRPALEAQESDHFQEGQLQQREGEEHMLAEMHRKGPEPEDYLDWMKR